MQTQATTSNSSVTPPLCADTPQGSTRESAQALIAAGHHNKALNVITSLLKEHNCDADLWSLAATAAHALQRFDDATTFWATAIAHDPTHFEAHYNLGKALFERHDLEPATAALLRTTELRPNDVPLLLNVASIFSQHRKFPEAITLLTQAQRLMPENTKIYEHLIHAYLAHNQSAEAKNWADRLVDRFPHAVVPLIARAQLYAQTGDLAAAERDVSRALAADPYNGLAHLLKVENRLGANSESDFKRLRVAYRHRKSREHTEQVLLSFALAKAAEASGDHALAFEAYAEGNRLHYTREPWNEDAQERHLQRVTQSVSKDTYETAATLRLLRPHVPGEHRPVFIVGMPRSGTSLLEQIVSSHPDVYGAGELTLLTELFKAANLGALNGTPLVPWLDALITLGEQYMADASRLSATEHIICDKMPGNYKFAGIIPLMMPHAKVIHIRRDPMDTCWSCFTTLFAEGHNYSFDQAVLGREYGRYRRWMQHWRTVMPAGTLLEIDYEDVVADLRGSAEAVLRHAGLEWHDACLDFHRNRRVVETASFAQVRQPLYSRSIGRWRPYERHLAPLRQALDETEPQTVN